jgi:hypothetical protein
VRIIEIGLRSVIDMCRLFVYITCNNKDAKKNVLEECFKKTFFLESISEYSYLRRIIRREEEVIVYRRVLEESIFNSKIPLRLITSKKVSTKAKFTRKKLISW